MRNHYLPRFLLRGFSDHDGLWRFDIRTGEYRQRSIENAGQHRSFYPVALETGLLQQIDGQASAVFARGLVDRRGTVMIGQHDKGVLSRWLALFMLRTPQTLSSFQKYGEEARANPAWAVEVIHDNRDHVIATIRSANPNKYDELVGEFGQSITNAMLLQAVARKIHDGSLPYVPDPKTSFGDYIEESRMERFADRLCRFQWMWYQTKGRFFVSDNPLRRWSKNLQKWDYGLNRKDIEITIPLASTLTLLMRRPQSCAKKVIHCPSSMTRELNRRQLLGTIEYAFGPDAELRRWAKPIVDGAIAGGVIEELKRHRP